MEITLKKLVHADLPKIIEMADDPTVANDMSTLPSPFTIEDAKELQLRSESTREVIRGVADNSSGELNGVIMLRDFEPSHEQAELSLWIGKQYWGKGYGTAAIKEMCRIGFRERNLNRIYAYCMVRNRASQRILEKSGFSQEGLLRERVIINGIYEDVYLYARLKKDV